MPANVRARANSYIVNDMVKALEMQTIQVQAAQSINRYSTTSGWRSVPVAARGTSPAGHFDGWKFMSNSVNYTRIALVGLPTGHVLTGVRVKLLPADIDRSGGPPGVLPSLTIYKRLYSTGVETQLGTTTYTWVDEATYEAGITLSKTFASETIDNTDCEYYFHLVTESGANSSLGTELQGVQATVTIDPSENGPDFHLW